jgi:glycosyltransferase involved in cell wall biosynthesis/MoaA/NifB/PqqE/SkfB family radical SAM enzyme
MRFNAGSEVYTQSLSQALAERHEVVVFTRGEDPFVPDDNATDEVDPDDPHVRLRVVNIPNSRDRYRRAGVDLRFAETLDQFQPHVVHIGHLNHLSTSVVHEAHRRNIPVVFTLHDYWLMCPRGQFIQMQSERDRVWGLCDGQDDRKCAERCYSRYFTGAADDQERDVGYWTDWVSRRMAHVREIASEVDLFIAPSQYLLRRFRDVFGLPARKLVYVDYGFHRERLRGRHRDPESDFVFGYIGTHIPAKGIHDLLNAFARVPGTPRLRVWGRHRGPNSDALRTIASHLPNDAGKRVEWLPEYRNAEIVRDVFDRVDAIVVPSVWVENSPLVIHEAQQVRVPVVTADVGGMSEYVAEGVNGVLFRHRDPVSLANAMTGIASDPVAAERLGARGYLFSDDGEVPDIREHASIVESLYARVIRERRSLRPPTQPGPWRVTFDTNPDDCNLQCVMCEEHSPHSDKQIRREEADLPKRRMSANLIGRVLNDLRDTPLREIIPSTMGEPLLFHEFETIIDLCVEHGLLMNLTTNGTFPRLGVRAWARKLVPILSDVKISWNGATKDTYETVMVGAQFEKAAEKLGVFVEERDKHAARFGHRARVTLQLTFLEINVGELPAMVRLAIDHGVDRVKGHHLWAHFTQIRNLSMRRSSSSIDRWNNAVRAARAIADQHSLPNGTKVVLENIHELGASAVVDLAPGAHCPFLGQEAWVSAESRFDPCCAPDEQRRTLGDFGNLAQVSINEVWNGSAYQRLRETYMDHALCRSCNMRQPEKAP